MTTTVVVDGAHLTKFTVMPMQCEHGSGNFQTLADLETALSHVIDNEQDRAMVLLSDRSRSTAFGRDLDRPSTQLT